MSRDPAISFRHAEPADRPAVSALLADTWRRHGSGALEDQAQLLGNGLSSIAMAGSEAVGFLGLDLRAPAGDDGERWADIQLAALAAGRRGDGVLGGLAEVSYPRLLRYGCTGIVALASSGWLSDGLSKSGFALEDQVVTYARNGTRAAWNAEQARPAHLRAATVADGPAILAINAAAFEPLWQYDDSVILGWLMASDHAIVAEADGHQAGFALTTAGLPGNYSHLIRVAVRRDDQGRGIGRQLVADAIRHAVESGAPGLALNTQASNALSRRLYESLDFKLTGHSLNVFVVRF